MTDFPAELHAHLALAIGAYADSDQSAADNERLAAAMDRACRHAHATGMLPEAMVIALRKSYESVAATDPLHQARLANAYDRLLSGCLQAYFEEKQSNA